MSGTLLIDEAAVEILRDGRGMTLKDRLESWTVGRGSFRKSDLDICGKTI